MSDTKGETLVSHFVVTGGTYPDCLIDSLSAIWTNLLKETKLKS